MPSRPRKRVVTVAAALVVLTLLIGLRQSLSDPPSRMLLWGVQVAPAPISTQLRSVSSVARAVGKRPSILPINVPFENCAATCFDYRFPTSALEALRRYGAIPVLNWSSMSTPLNRDEPGYSLRRVANGAYDQYIRSFALAAKAWGHPFFLRFNWEMNADWFPWAERANGNRPGDFVRAWRHVHRIFASVGASNATWVWCPIADLHSSRSQLRELFPGRAYVDWTCMDGYNFGALHGPGWLGHLRAGVQLDLCGTPVARAARTNDDRARLRRPSTAARRPRGSGTCSRRYLAGSPGCGVSSGSTHQMAGPTGRFTRRMRA